ncbi:type II secretion system protein [Puniceicoccus vermicola]|nr:type II secretion system protein [Puniceicoccus vermicola]
MLGIQSRRHSGFTLIELLAVLAVIAILAGLIYVGVGKVLQSARTTQLSSHMRNVHMGLMSYVAENKGVFPGAAGHVNTPGDNSWQAAVAPYLGEGSISPQNWYSAKVIENSVFHDPLDTSLKTSGSERPIRNIAINGMSGEGDIPTGVTNRRANTIEFPARLMALTTGISSKYGDEFSKGGMRVNHNYYKDEIFVDQLTRIPGEYYCVFVDGHLEVRTLDEMLEEASLGANSVFFDPAGSNGKGWP